MRRYKRILMQNIKSEIVVFCLRDNNFSKTKRQVILEATAD